MTAKNTNKPKGTKATPRNRTILDPAVYGDPETTPFVRYESGTPVYPPNLIYSCAHELLKQPPEFNLAEVCKSLIQRGPLGGQYAVLPDSTWFSIMQCFFRYHDSGNKEVSNWQLSCRKALEIMQERPHQAAWERLKSFLREDIDNLSGWNKSSQKSSAERDRIFRGEDGNYYYHDEEGILVQVIGSKTLEETRVDFITDQLIHSHGFLYQFIALFSLFAISDDYATNTARYPRSMRAVLPSSNFYDISHYWHFTFHERTRSIVWRPDSNKCDPRWLVGDLLALIADTLEVDYWRKRVDMMRRDSDWMEPDCSYQSDYVLDSSLRIGPDEEAMLEFEGKKFRWFNGTVERDAIISMGVRDYRNQDEENDKLNRLLTALVWEYKMPIRKIWGGGGPRRPFPTVYGPRQSGGVQVDPQYLPYALKKSRTPEQWFALSLFREAINSRSKFYSFLCFWKIIELAHPKKDERRHWVNDVATGSTREKETLGKILGDTTDLDEYLRKERRDAIAHVFQEKRAGSATTNRPVNPDDPKHEAIISRDIGLIEDFARMAIWEMLKE